MQLELSILIFLEYGSSAFLTVKMRDSIAKMVMEKYKKKKATTTGRKEVYARNLNEKMKHHKGTFKIIAKLL